MILSDEKIQEIITNNCGDPPVKEKLKFTISLNQHKLEFYTKYPFLKGQEHQDDLNSYRNLITAAVKKLNELA